MGLAITRVELDLADRNRLHPHIELGARSATASHALPLRNLSFTPPSPVNSHAHSVDTQSAGMSTKEPQVTVAADRSLIDLRKFVGRLVGIWLPKTRSRSHTALTHHDQQRTYNLKQIKCLEPIQVSLMRRL
jgi:hypothetical protein